MDQRLKDLMQQLGNAINESLAESEDIAEAIGEIKREGYDVFLVLEATIGFNKRAEDLETEFAPESSVSSGEISLTDQDHAFLRALKITVEE